MGDRQGAGSDYSVTMNDAPEKARVVSSPVLDGGDTEQGAHGNPSGGPSQAHRDVIAKLCLLFENRQEDLDLALMKVIAEGGSPAEWLVGMLRRSMPPEEPAAPRARFLGE
jgi:hypothetical protein